VIPSTKARTFCDYWPLKFLWSDFFFPSIPSSTFFRMDRFFAPSLLYCAYSFFFPNSQNLVFCPRTRRLSTSPATHCQIPDQYFAPQKPPFLCSFRYLKSSPVQRCFFVTSCFHRFSQILARSLTPGVLSIAPFFKSVFLRV